MKILEIWWPVLIHCMLAQSYLGLRWRLWVIEVGSDVRMLHYLERWIFFNTIKVQSSAREGKARGGSIWSEGVWCEDGTASNLMVPTNAKGRSCC